MLFKSAHRLCTPDSTHTYSIVRLAMDIERGQNPSDKYVGVANGHISIKIPNELMFVLNVS